jgi:hypothetical protein
LVIEVPWEGGAWHYLEGVGLTRVVVCVVIDVLEHFMRLL